MFMVFLLLVLNFAISWWNATQVGKAWVETKFAGGWMRFMAWCGATMAACGFTWCILITMVLAGSAIDPKHFTEPVVTTSLQLGYVVIIPAVLMSGYAIMFDSWARAWRERSATSLGIAGWNTFANAYNTYNAVRDFGGAFKDVSKFFESNGKSKNSDAAAAILVAALVSVALLGGVLLTAAIIRKNAASNPLPHAVRERVAYA